MATPDQIAANRRNAGRSTGPRTAAGKRKAAANNALRHAIIASVESDPAMGAAVARIVAALAGPNPSPGLRALVTPIAEAQVDVLRVRSARAKLIDLAATTAASAVGETDAIVESLPRLVLLDRYERSAMRRRHRAMRELRKSFTMWGK
jgi:predicted trehalose synthase